MCHLSLVGRTGASGAAGEQSTDGPHHDASPPPARRKARPVHVALP